MKLAVRLALSLVVALALVGALLAWSGTDPYAVATTLQSLDARVYWTALAVQAPIYPLRALRLRVLAGDTYRGGFARLVPVTAAHILAANVVPAKVGEAALVYYLRRACGVPAARGLAWLLVTRLLDLAAVTGGLALACLSLGILGTFPSMPWLTALGSALLVPTFVLAWLSARGERLVHLVAALSRWTRLDTTRLGSRALAFAERVREGLVAVRARGLAAGALLSLPIWGLVFLFYAVLGRGFGLGELGFAEAVFGAGLAVLANLLPVNGFAGFGPQDMGWVVGFVSLGVPRELATTSALAVHLVYLFNIALFGVLGHVVLGWLGAPAGGVRDPVEGTR